MGDGTVWLMRYLVICLALLAVSCGTGSSGAGTTIATNDPTTSTEGSPIPSAPTTEGSDSSTAAATTPPPGSGLFTSEGIEIPLPPETPPGPISAALEIDLNALFDELETGLIEPDSIARVAAHGDPRTAWIFTDVLRFSRLGPQSDSLVNAFESVTGVELPTDDRGGQWKGSLDYLIGWDLPAIDGYVGYKARLYVSIEPGWAPFFDDPGSNVDWRLVSWGGVFIDNRPLGEREGCPRGCIPALDDPTVTDAAGGDWLDDDRIVFGVSINGESRAYPKHQMETHEMINDTLGGRRIGIPYCTLCGSAQAYFTDSVPAGVDVPVLRTSGLLSRSNKVMFDLVTFSLFDTFTGEALSGPLRESGVRLDQATVVASTWGGWKQAHPDTTILAEDGGIGFVYRIDPLGGRDDNGPIFPVGDVDPRLGVQEIVVGVELSDGSVVAFPKATAVDQLRAGGSVEFSGVALFLDGSGLRAERVDGTTIATHESFWFAWSQFWPETAIWTP